MESLKEIIKKYPTAYESENVEGEAVIIMEWLEENFDPRLMKEIITRVYENKINDLAYQNKKLLEHQNWNYLTYNKVVFDMIRNDIKNVNFIQSETFPFITNLLRMYIDNEISPSRALPKDIYKILKETKFADEELNNWLKN